MHGEGSVCDDTRMLKDQQESVLWEDTISPGASWSLVLRRGNALRLTDIAGGANAAALFYNFECPVERYNMPDTLKAQHQSELDKALADVERLQAEVERLSAAAAPAAEPAPKKSPRGVQPAAAG